MKEGRPLTDLATELKRQLETKRDYVVDTRALTMADDGAHIEGLSEESFGITTHCHHQIADKLDIPRKYYDRMKVSWPLLLSASVNTFMHGEPSKRMVRTLDGEVRAMLSDRYRPIDHADVAEAVLPLIGESSAQIASCELTSTKMYLKWICPSIRAEVRVGEVVEAGGIISNSEVGDGSFRISPFVNVLACLNGMVVNKAGMRKFHVGRQSEIADGAVDLYSTETIAKDNEALFAKVQDLARAILSNDGFEQIVEMFQESTQRDITHSAPAVIKEVTGRYNLNGRQGDSILDQLTRSGDMTQWGLSQAITRVSQDEDDYEMATEMERIGGQVVGLGNSGWQSLMEAAAA